VLASRRIGLAALQPRRDADRPQPDREVGRRVGPRCVHDGRAHDGRVADARLIHAPHYLRSGPAVSSVPASSETDGGRRVAIEAVVWDFGGVFTTSPFEASTATKRLAGCPGT